MNIDNVYIKDAVITIQHNKELLNRIHQIWPFIGSPLIKDIMVGINMCVCTLEHLEFAAYEATKVEVTITSAQKSLDTNTKLNIHQQIKVMRTLLDMGVGSLEVDRILENFND